MTFANFLCCNMCSLHFAMGHEMLKCQTLFVFFCLFFLCFISGIEEEGEKTWLPCFPGSFLVLLPVYWNVFMEIIGEMMV